MKIIFAILLFVLGGLFGCSSTDRSTAKGTFEPELIQKLDQQLLEAEELVNKDPLAAREKFDRFLVENPRSPFTQRAHLGRGLSFENAEDWAQALLIYERIVTTMRFEQPTAAGLAMYRASICQEALGNELKAFTLLKDAEVLKNHLPLEIQLGELPARLGIYYFKRGDTAQSLNYFRRADSGLSAVRVHRQDQTLIAKTYYNIGAFPVLYGHPGELERTIENTKLLQSYLVRSIEMEVEPWSIRAFERLKKSYYGSWNFILNYKSKDTFYPQDEFFDLNQRRKWTAMLLENLETLKLFVDRDNPAGASLRQWINILQSDFEKFLYSPTNDTKRTRDQ